MKFNEFRFLYPPRPSKAIGTGMLSFYEKRKWVAQYKKNGTCTVLYVTPEKEIITRTRHGDEHKRWEPSATSSAPFKAIPGKGWNVFVVEVLHSKVSGIRDTIYIFDILVLNGEELLGTTFIERQATLMELFGIREDNNSNVVSLFTESHYVLNSNVWLAKLIKSNFKGMMQQINRQAPETGAPENEGIVMKNPNARLQTQDRATSNGQWQVKCRIEHANYDF